MKMIRFLIFISLGMWSGVGWSYSNFIGYGYTSCLNCHFNAFGGGPLNDYGRSLAASEISGRFLMSNDEEELANQSGFLGTVKIPKWWRPSLNYRGLYMSQSVLQGQQNRYITMQASMANVIRLDPQDRFIVVVDFGYVPKPFQATSTDPAANKNWISREYYAKVDLGKPSRVYVGFLDKVFGLRVPDHEAFSRKKTYNGQNDQVHGVAYHYSKLPVELGVQAFAGNLSQEADVRLMGASSMLELELAEKWRVGFSGMYAKNNYINLRAASVHTRVGVGSGSSIMMENGLLNVVPTSQTLTEKWGFYSFTQGFLKLWRGFHYLTTLEYYTQDIRTNTTRQMRFGPGLLYFPMQRVEFRLDAYNERSFDPDIVKKDDWTLLSQLHLWF